MRALADWAKGGYREFTELLENESPSWEIADRLCWLEGRQELCEVIKWCRNQFVRMTFSPLFCKQMGGLLHPAFDALLRFEDKYLFIR